MRNKFGAEVFCMGIDIEGKLSNDRNPNVVWTNDKVMMIVVGVKDGVNETIFAFVDLLRWVIGGSEDFAGYSLKRGVIFKKEFDGLGFDLSVSGKVVGPMVRRFDCYGHWGEE
jgi:hypothetical protein